MTNQNKKEIKVRFAPSPTGFLHIGSLRTALYNWLFARKYKGKLILRIEDTDQTRLVKGAVENILESLSWYGLDYDEGPIFQSKRFSVYKEYADQLVKEGHAYHCFCSQQRLDELRKFQEANKLAPKYDGFCRNLSEKKIKEKIAKNAPYVIRLKVPEEGSVEFEDIIKGKVIFENKNIDDQVLIKSDGFPTYHLANVVDDNESKISHVIRGDEWLSSTPKHILLYQAFGWMVPEFAHLPIILAPDRSKLSKRHGATSALEYKNLGYLSEAVLNFIALLGWNPGTDREVFSKNELIENFDLKNVNKSSAIFDFKKLDWLNGFYIRSLNTDKLVEYCLPFLKIKKVKKDYLKRVIKLFQERLHRLDEIENLADFFFKKKLNYSPAILIPKKFDKDFTLKTLELTLHKLEDVDEKDFQAKKLKKIFEEFIKKNNLNNMIVLWPLRVALTGKEASPDVFDIMEVLGKDNVVSRVVDGVRWLKEIQ